MKFPDSRRLKASRIYWNYATKRSDCWWFRNWLLILFPVVNWWSHEMQIVVLPHERVSFINFVFVFSIEWKGELGYFVEIAQLHRHLTSKQFTGNLRNGVSKNQFHPTNEEGPSFTSLNRCCCSTRLVLLITTSPNLDFPNSRSSRQWTHPRNYQSMGVRSSKKYTHVVDKGAKWEEKKMCHSDGNLISLKRRIANVQTRIRACSSTSSSSPLSVSLHMKF